MRYAFLSQPMRFLLASVAAVGLAAAVQAQTFEADYDIVRPAAPNLRLSPVLQSSPEFSGVGLSLQGSSNWFGQVGVGRQPAAASMVPNGQVDVMNVGGGYRFSNGQSLSLQLSRGRGPGQRLGLAVNYDWPAYFVRFSWDQGQNLVPQDNLRFSAGVRF